MKQVRASLCWARALGILALSSVLFGAPDTKAYELKDLTWPCGYAKWIGDPTYGFLQVSFSTDFTRAAVREPGQRVNAAGGQSFDFSGWAVYGDNTPTKNRNEIWKTGGLGPGVLGITIRRYTLCWIQEADVVFRTTAQANWHHAEPDHYGDTYWNTTDTNSVRYLRTTALHELLHAAGLDHEDNQYSFTNYGTYPWAHRGDGLQLEPLPDDRRGLRYLYGNNSSERDVAVLNTHVIPTSSIGVGVSNCTPSAGTGFSDIWDLGAFCGNDWSDEVCPGDRIYTAYQVVNYGTVSTTTTQRLYFSTGSWLSDDDVPSTSHYVHGIGAGANRHRNHSFRVPNLPPGTYWPIIEIDTNLSEESSWNNWIPLVEQIVVPEDCP